MWFGFFGGPVAVWAVIMFGANLHMKRVQSGNDPGDGFEGGLLVLTMLFAIPAMVGSLARGMDVELSWRALGALLPGRERRFARAYWVMAAGSVVPSVLCFWWIWSWLELDLGSGLQGAPHWTTPWSLAAIGYVAGLWYRPRLTRWLKYVWQLPVLLALGFAARPFCLLATQHVWVGLLAWVLAIAALYLRTRPQPALLERTRRGPTVLAVIAGEPPHVPDAAAHELSNEMPPAVTGGSHRGWVQAQRFALRSTVSRLGSLRLAVLGAGFFLALHFAFFFAAWSFGFKTDLRIEFVHSLLGAPGAGEGSLQLPSGWLDVPFDALFLMYGLLGSLPLFGVYFYPMSRDQRARMVFRNTVHFGLLCSCSMVVVGCGVGFGVRALGEPIAVASVPATLGTVLFLFGMLPLLVTLTVKSMSLLSRFPKQPLLMGLYAPLGFMVFNWARRAVNSSHVLELEPSLLFAAYLAFLCLTYGTLFVFTRHHFRRADISLGIQRA